MEVPNRPTGVPFLLWALAAQLVLCGSGLCASDNTKNCKLLYETQSEREALSRLEPLTRNNFTVETKNGDESYSYVFQICGDAGGIQKAGLIQISSTPMKTTVIGMYNATQAIGGTDWVFLIYGNGEKYDAHCSQEKRKAIVMISCNRKMVVGQLKVRVEERERQQDCFYLFELDTNVVCPLVEYQLSSGSIILIIGFCVLAVYLIGGFLYQRLVVGSKGMEQFPNYAFWVEVGNLTADGCDFVCRSRNREEPPTYRGVVTEPLEEEPEERDDNLLPM